MNSREAREVFDCTMTQELDYDELRDCLVAFARDNHNIYTQKIVDGKPAYIDVPGTSCFILMCREKNCFLFLGADDYEEADMKAKILGRNGRVDIAWV